MPARQPVSLTLRTRGAVLGGVGAALLAAGFWRVDGEMAALGLAALCLLALAWVLARLNVAGLEVSVAGPGKTRAGLVFPLRITIGNRIRWLDAFGVRVELGLAGQVRVGGFAAWVSSGSAADLELRVALPGRGVVSEHGFRLLSDFPFGLFACERSGVLRHALTILPRPVVPDGFHLPGMEMDALEVDGFSAGEAPGEFRSLRGWRLGDSPRRIVWPATLRSLAKGAEMVVRECDPPGFRPASCVVVFHSFGGDGGLIQPERFERALSLAAGCLKHLRGMGVRVRWVADFNDWSERVIAGRGQLEACLDELAVVKRCAVSEAHDLQAALAAVGEDEGLVVLSDMPLVAWRAVVPDEAFAPEVVYRKRRMEVAR